MEYIYYYKISIIRPIITHKVVSNLADKLISVICMLQEMSFICEVLIGILHAVRLNNFLKPSTTSAVKNCSLIFLTRKILEYNARTFQYDMRVKFWLTKSRL